MLNINKKYLDLVIPQHCKPKFKKWLSIGLNLISKTDNVLLNLDSDFDIDNSKGEQLDILGDIVGIKRELTFQPLNCESSVLDDYMYRNLLKTKIGINHWNGNIPDAHELWENLFSEYEMVIKDNQDMSMEVEITGDLSMLEKQLLRYGYIIPKPEGVRINLTTISETVLEEKTVYLCGAVFNGIETTILPEFEIDYNLNTKFNIGFNAQTIEETLLPYNMKE